MKSYLFLLSLVTLLLAPRSSFAASIGVDVDLGMTYRSGDSVDGGTSFPALGVGIYAKSRNFSLRNFLESDSFATTLGAGESHILSWTSFATVEGGIFYVGIGGGGGIEKYAGTHVAYPWAGALIGLQITKFINLSVRPMFNLSGPSYFSSMYTVMQLGIRVIQDD